MKLLKLDNHAINLIQCRHIYFETDDIYVNGYGK